LIKIIRAFAPLFRKGLPVDSLFLKYIPDENLSLQFQLGVLRGEMVKAILIRD
jgi:hypothetical protein